MDNKLLNAVVDSVVKENNYGSYKIKGMKLSKQDYSINQNGELESIQYIDVIIETENKREITISVKNE